MGKLRFAEPDLDSAGHFLRHSRVSSGLEVTGEEAFALQNGASHLTKNQLTYWSTCKSLKSW
jgi:hypothetical protein